MLDVKAKGAHTELQCITYLHGLGYDVSVPWGDNARYDFILDVNNRLYRIQCKTSRKIGEGTYKFNCFSSRINRSKNRIIRYTKEDIDFFCTYIENRCYMIPVDETSKEKTLHLIPIKTNQVKRIAYAEQYLAEKQIALLPK